jgi:hypothetical protein
MISLGGLPYWLITDGAQILRLINSVFIERVDDFSASSSRGSRGS